MGWGLSLKRMPNLPTAVSPSPSPIRVYPRYPWLNFPSPSGCGHATDPTKPDGTPRKLLDVGRIGNLGWRAKIGLDEGLAETYRWFVEHAADVRR